VENESMCVYLFYPQAYFRPATDEICCTRDFLEYGERTTVDTSLWRLVGRGMLLRVADGVLFERFKNTSVEEIVKAKAAKFGKEKSSNFVANSPLN